MKKNKKDYLVKGILFFAVFLLTYTVINILSLGRAYFYFGMPFEVKIPVIPLFLIIYASSYLLIAMPFFVLKRKNEIRKLIYIYSFIAAISFVIFLIIPAKVVRPAGFEGFMAGLLNLFWGYIDLPYNTMPSLHISLSLAGAYLMRKYFNFAFLLVWVFLIAVSALLIKQHYILDIITGLILSILVIFLFRKWK